jgi:hypothetical protein
LGFCSVASRRHCCTGVVNTHARRYVHASPSSPARSPIWPPRRFSAIPGKRTQAWWISSSKDSPWSLHSVARVRCIPRRAISSHHKAQEKDTSSVPSVLPSVTSLAADRFCRGREDPSAEEPVAHDRFEEFRAYDDDLDRSRHLSRGDGSAYEGQEYDRLYS